MKFSYNWLQSFFKKKLPEPEKLARLLTMHSFEVEAVEKKGNDFVLDIDILPNRAPDCFSHIGIAKECAALLNYKLQITNYKQIPNFKFQTKDFISVEVSVEVRLQQACPRYTAKVITDVKVGPSPKWLKERLKVCGLKAINNIVDIANYAMLETGQPLHVFDFEKIKSVKIPNSKFQIPNSKTIIVRKAKKGEKIVTLDEKNYSLDQDVLVIADLEKPLAIAGIKGGKGAGIDKNTKIIVLESANFSSGVIRKGSRKLGLRTDASIRFEYGIDPNLTELAINRAAYLIQKITKGKVIKEVVDVYPKKVLPKQVKLNLDYLERLLGVKISQREIINILKKLEFKVTEDGPRQNLIVGVPTFRLDVSIQEDLIEEIARIYGYENIPSRLPETFITLPQKNISLFWEEKIKDILKSSGFSESYNYTFISKEQSSCFDYSAVKLIEVESPVSIEQKYLRPSLIPNLLRNVHKNQKFYKEIKIFELGKIFIKKFKIQNSKFKSASQKSKLKEEKMLTGLIAKKGSANDLFYELKGVVDLLLNRLGISNIWYNEYQTLSEEMKSCWWEPKKCVEIRINREQIGFFGEISFRVLDNLKIEPKIIYFDIDFEKLSKFCSEEKIYQPISRYPKAVRDIAVLVSRETKVDEVLNKIQLAGGSLVKNIDLFDIYEGGNIPNERKNFAFHIIYQAENKTLSSKEIDEIHQKIIKALEEDRAWEVRQ